MLGWTVVTRTATPDCPRHVHVSITPSVQREKHGSMRDPHDNCWARKCSLQGLRHSNRPAPGDAHIATSLSDASRQGLDVCRHVALKPERGHRPRATTLATFCECALAPLPIDHMPHGARKHITANTRRGLGRSTSMHHMRLAPRIVGVWPLSDPASNLCLLFLGHAGTPHASYIWRDQMSSPHDRADDMSSAEPKRTASPLGAAALA